MIRTLLVHVQADEPGKQRLAVAADLARRLDANLIGLGAQAVPPMAVPFGLMEGTYLEAMETATGEQLAQARAAFAQATEGLAAEWHQTKNLPVEAMAMVSRAADLIVASAEAGDRFHGCNTGELVLISGRPVLVAPPSGQALSGRAVLVAWKDTRESRRALADALPFLQMAERVRLVEVCESGEEEDVQARLAVIAASLRRHGVEAETAPLAGRLTHVAEKLDHAAGEIGADLIVFGGYGHSRFGEWVFGGVTRALLNGCSRFLLMSH
jgi:nucleotide-binding universal stress UspA family protein